MDTLLSNCPLFKEKVLPTAYVIVEVVKMQNLMTELQQLYLRHDEITEDWEKIGYWIIERELLEQIVKKYETCPHKKYK